VECFFFGLTDCAQAVAAASLFHVVHCADVSADHVILGELQRGELGDDHFQLVPTFSVGACRDDFCRGPSRRSPQGAAAQAAWRT